MEKQKFPEQGHANNTLDGGKVQDMILKEGMLWTKVLQGLEACIVTLARCENADERIDKTTSWNLLSKDTILKCNAPKYAPIKHNTHYYNNQFNDK